MGISAADPRGHTVTARAHHPVTSATRCCGPSCWRIPERLRQTFGDRPDPLGRGSDSEPDLDISAGKAYILGRPKHLVDIDEAALATSQAELEAASMNETVNEA